MDTPINQVASINIQDARTLSVQTFEASMVTAVEKAIMKRLVRDTKALKELSTLVQKYCGGEVELFYLDKEISKVCDASNLENRLMAADVPEPDYHSHEAFKTRKEKQVANLNLA